MTRFVPAEVDTGSDDARRLGVALRLLVNNERPAEADFIAGWHAPEGDGSWRWTDGDATLAMAMAMAMAKLPGPGWLRLSMMAGGARYWTPVGRPDRAMSVS